MGSRRIGPVGFVLALRKMGWVLMVCVGGKVGVFRCRSGVRGWWGEGMEVVTRL